MDAERFDALTRAVARATSRRQSLRVLAAGAAAGLAALLGRNAAVGQGSPLPQKVFLPALAKADAPITYREAGAAELAELDQDALADPDFVALQTLLSAGGFTVTKREGALGTRAGAVTAKTLVVHYQRESASNRAFLIFGGGLDNGMVSFVVRYDSTVAFPFGLYRDLNGATQVELGAAPSAGAQQPEVGAAGTIPLVQAAAETQSCQQCQSICASTLQNNLSSCVLASTVHALRVGREVRASGGGNLGNLAGKVGTITSLKIVVDSIGGCLSDRPPICGASGPLCASSCATCTANGCGPGGACIGGACRALCGSSVCNSGEICGPDGLCRPAANTCPAGSSYAGLYRFGNQLAPACCGVREGVNCGAASSGIWGGCCPKGTFCKPLSVGYGCCTPGLNC